MARNERESPSRSFVVMRKLSATQIDAVRLRDGLFDFRTWRSCVSYLHALQTNEDPENSGEFAHVTKLVASFVAWSLLAATAKFGSTGVRCLQLAASKTMLPELEHSLHEAPCVFSGRTSVLALRSPSAPVPQAVSKRVQRQFVWWEHHEQTGLESPHFSEAFVYESQFTYLVQSFHALGHFADIAKAKARELWASGVTHAVEFQAHPMWKEFYEKINCLFYVVYAQLTLHTGPG
jgi:hypothetical protein